MAFRRTLLIAAAGVLLSGCNQLSRVGSKAVVFDSDPFTQLDAAHPQTQTTQTDGAAGGASFADMNSPAQPGAAAHGTAQAHVAAGTPTQNQWSPGAQPVSPRDQFTQSPQAPPPAMRTGPAARAEADVAAMLAAQQQQHVGTADYTAPSGHDFSGVHQAGYQASSQPGAVVAADPFAETATGGVPGNPFAAPDAAAGFEPAAGQYQLSEKDLELPPLPEPQLLPGTNVPAPVGRATLQMQPVPAWDPPATGTVPTQPVFSPPATGSTVPQRPVMQDSTSHTKWRAARRS